MELAWFAATQQKPGITAMPSTFPVIPGGLRSGPEENGCIVMEPSDSVSLHTTPTSHPRVLEIVSVLQTTLAVEKLIQLFATEVNRDVPHDGMLYRHEEHEQFIQVGRHAPHRCEYWLTINSQPLGRIRFMRRQRFTSRELTELENLISAMLYPLRNAQMYQLALRTAYKDPLTGAKNRAAFECTMGRELSLARRQGAPLSLCVLDIDHFKRINDSYGHACGDVALRAVADCVANTIRSSDILFRYGGEEFVILLNNTALQGAFQLAERIRQALENLNSVYQGQPLKLTASIGVATLQKDDDEYTLFKRADAALYKAKEEGRNRVLVSAN